MTMSAANITCINLGGFVDYTYRLYARTQRIVLGGYVFLHCTIPHVKNQRTHSLGTIISHT